MTRLKVISGESGGYLRSFSYTDHESFYRRYCDLNFMVSELRRRHDSMRRTFEEILKDAASHEEAKIIRGAFAKISASSYYGPRKSVPRLQTRRGELDRIKR